MNIQIKIKTKITILLAVFKVLTFFELSRVPFSFFVLSPLGFRGVKIGVRFAYIPFVFAMSPPHGGKSTYAMSTSSERGKRVESILQPQKKPFCSILLTSITNPNPIIKLPFMKIARRSPVKSLGSESPGSVSSSPRTARSSIDITRSPG